MGKFQRVEYGRRYNPFYELVPQDISGELDDMLREHVLAQLDQFTGWVVKDRSVGLQCPQGRAVLTADKGIVGVDYVSDKNAQDRRRYRFWINASSLSDLSAKLRTASKERAIEWDTLFETKIRYHTR